MLLTEGTFSNDAITKHQLDTAMIYKHDRMIKILILRTLTMSSTAINQLIISMLVVYYQKK